VPTTNILVIADDLDSATAVVKLKQRGGHGGHNGLRSIIAQLGNSQDFPRIKIGGARHLPACSSGARPARPAWNERAGGGGLGQCCQQLAQGSVRLLPRPLRPAGIGRPAGQLPVASYVLQPFSKSEMADMDGAIAESLRIVDSVLSLGLMKALSGVRT
jgi:PTH1 family peptidyl-tRNA hydrolase